MKKLTSQIHFIFFLLSPIVASGESQFQSTLKGQIRGQELTTTTDHIISQQVNGQHAVVIDKDYTEITLDYLSAKQILLEEEEDLKSKLTFPEYTLTTFETQNDDPDTTQLRINLNVDYYDAFEDLKIRKWLAKLSDRQNHALRSLEQLSEEGNVDASYLLADINLFGNFSLPTNATKALYYYEQTSQESENARANYMTAFIYATGLFGKVEMDEGKAILYYELAAEQGDIKAAMCLAYRYYKGLSVPQNFDLALFYYSMVAQDCYEFIADGPLGGPNLDNFGIRIADLHHGMYGDGVNETPPSITLKPKREGDENIFTAESDSRTDYFFPMLRSSNYYYNGDYNRERNYTKAFEKAYQCATEGKELIDAEAGLNFRTHPKFYEVVGSCCAKVGHMYLRGEGAQKSWEKAEYWLKIASRYTKSSDISVDLGFISEVYHSASDEDHVNKTVEFYDDAATLGSTTGMFHLARYRSANSIDSGSKSSLSLIEQAARRGQLESMYYLAQEYEKGTKLATNRYIASLYKSFIEKVEPVVSDLRWSFNQLINGKNDLALIGYAMAAEQGYEEAQNSVAYMLYSPVGYLEEMPNVPLDRFRSAINYYGRSAKQGNLDSTVFLGDMYYYGVLNTTYKGDNESEEYLIQPDLEKAASIYHKASGMKSAQAKFNLGYMYEMGIGVPKDLHLAKRYYDLALYTNPAACIPIQFSLIRLHLKKWWYDFCGMDLSGSSSSTTESDSRITWKDWLKLYRRLRDDFDVAMYREMQYQQELDRVGQYEADLQQQQQQHQQGEGEGTGVRAALDDFEPAFDSTTEDLIVITLVLGFIVFALVNRFFAIRRERDANGNNNDNNNENNDENNNNNNNNNNDNGGGRFGNFQFQFVFIPL